MKRGWMVSFVTVAWAVGCASAPSERDDQNAQSPFSHKPEPTECAGFLGLACPNGEVCMDVPDDDCDPNHGGADCPGQCVAIAGSCAGFIGGDCDKGFGCQDVPDDGCDPNAGGADCPGLCVADGLKLQANGGACGPGTGGVCVPGTECLPPPYQCFAECPNICQAI